MAWSAPLHVALAFGATFAVIVSGCAPDLAGADDDRAGEMALTSSSEAAADVDCNTTTMKAYDNGQETTVDVITIAGKLVSKATGHAFLKMRESAGKSAVSISINSGFRTNEEQQHLFDCFQTRGCNGGNLAAPPGFSNHQSGRALDLTTPSWLVKNAEKFGFKRTVPSEAWHYEFFGDDPGGPCTTGPRATPGESPSLATQPVAPPRTPTPPEGPSSTPFPPPSSPAPPRSPTPPHAPPSGGSSDTFPTDPLSFGCFIDQECPTNMLCQNNQCVDPCLLSGTFLSFLCGP